MPPRAEVVLSELEREVLERWARRPKSAQSLALRCRIVLAAAEGQPSREIAARLGCTTSTVGRWRGRFARRGLDGLHDEPRPGKPRSIGDADVERVIVKTLEEQPPNATHWSTRSMAAATGMSQTAVSRIWRAFGLKPHQTETFKATAARSTTNRSAGHRPDAVKVHAHCVAVRQVPPREGDPFTSTTSRITLTRAARARVMDRFRRSVSHSRDGDCAASRGAEPIRSDLHAGAVTT
jgi:transposase